MQYLTTEEAVQKAIQAQIPYSGGNLGKVLDEIIPLISFTLQEEFVRRYLTRRYRDTWSREAIKQVNETAGPRDEFSTDERYASGKYVSLYAQVCNGSPDLDPASSDIANSGNGIPGRGIHAKKYFTAQDDGLAQSWDDAQRIWLAPPYSNGLTGKFCTKLAEWLDAGSRGSALREAMLLVPNSSDTSWYIEMEDRAAAICKLHDRAFWKPDGTDCSVPQPHVIMYFGPMGEKFSDIYQQFGRVEKKPEASPKQETPQEASPKQETPQAAVWRKKRERREQRAVDARERITQRVASEDFLLLLREQPLEGVIEQYRLRNEWRRQVNGGSALWSSWMPGVDEFHRHLGCTPGVASEVIKEWIENVNRQITSKKQEILDELRSLPNTRCISRNCDDWATSNDGLCLNHGGELTEEFRKALRHKNALENALENMPDHNFVIQAYGYNPITWYLDEIKKEHTRKHWREAAREEFRSRVFTLPDGSSVSGGDATIEQLQTIMKQALTEAVECSYAIEDIQEAGVASLNELTVPLGPE